MAALNSSGSSVVTAPPVTIAQKALVKKLGKVDTPCLVGVAEAIDKFSWMLAARDFDRDGFTDVVIRVTFESVGSMGATGAVSVLYGSAGGLTATGNRFWSQEVRMRISSSRPLRPCGSTPKPPGIKGELVSCHLYKSIRSRCKTER
jgi:hypothetical protein